MPAQTAPASASSILAKLKQRGADKAWNKHKADETRFGAGGDLPSGIEGGVAQLTTAKLDTHKDGDNKGEPYLILTGIVKRPAVHGDVQTRGLRAMKIVGLYARKARGGGKDTTMEDAIDNALNEMRKLGVETEGLTLDDWPDVLNALQETKPHFRFRTWTGQATPQFPNPRVNVDFRGVIEDYVDDSDGSDGIVDETGGETAAYETNGHAGAEDGTDTATQSYAGLGEAADAGEYDPQVTLTEAAKEAGLDPEAYPSWTALGEALDGSGEASESEEGSEAGDVFDFVGDGEAADNGDQEAADRLCAAATEAGLDPNDGDTYPTFAALAEALSGSSGEEATDDWEPAKEEIYKYKAPGMKKAVEMEVVSFNKAKRTVNLKDLNTDRAYSGVPWDKLERE